MDAAAIEQMNKVRVSLGMAPLPVPGQDAQGPEFKGDESDSDESDDLSTLEKRQALSGSNWQKLEDEKKEKIERQKRKDAAKKARDAAQRFAKLEGKGLGEADEEEELDTKTWLLRQKKRQKKIEKARKMEEELAAREQQAEYTSKDLAGVKVGHEVDQFDEFTGEQVLTLKDTEIGEESEDDELENADMKAKEKLDEKLRLQKKKPDYDPTEEGEAGAVLSKYDEEIGGKQSKRFTLDGKGTSAAAVQKQRKEQEGNKGKGIQISLDMFQDDTPVSDYLDPAKIKMKKPRKSKKEKKTRQKADDDDDVLGAVQPAPAADANAMDVDGEPSKKRAFDFEDDEDLQAKLAEQRRATLKKRKKTDAAELARQMREEMPVDEPEEDDGGLVIDETSEFVANLKKPEAEEERPIRKAPAVSTEPQEDDEDEDGDTAMAGQSYAEAEEQAERQARMDHAAAEAPADEKTATGLDEEESLSGGVAGMLGMLRKRGIVEHSSGDLADRERKRTEFLSSKQNLIDDYDHQARDQRERDRRSGKFDNMSTKNRDEYSRQQNEAREAYIARLLADKFNKEYRPDVKLEYHDEHGRSMNQKEAFKHMSHMFHGKGSGKQKTEKRLKKIDDEQRNMSKGTLNVSEEGGMMNVQGREGKRQKQAGVRLQ